MVYEVQPTAPIKLLPPYLFCVHVYVYVGGIRRHGGVVEVGHPHRLEWKAGRLYGVYNVIGLRDVY